MSPSLIITSCTFSTQSLSLFFSLVKVSSGVLSVSGMEFVSSDETNRIAMDVPVFSLGTLTTHTLSDSNFTRLSLPPSCFLSFTSNSDLYSISNSFFTSLTTGENTPGLLGLALSEERVEVIVERVDVSGCVAGASEEGGGVGFWLSGSYPVTISGDTLETRSKRRVRGGTLTRHVG
jgi:hypothetical protein